MAIAGGLVPAGLGVSSGRTAAATGIAPPDTAGWILSTTTIGADYHPTYLGNGYMGTRVPADGEGFLSTPVATETHVAGVYEQLLDNSGLAAPPGLTTLAVALPQWTGLEFNDGSGIWSTASGKLLSYLQSLDLWNGVLTTTARWQSTAGKVTDLSYQVVVDRARLHVGVVRLRLTPEWSGAASVEDVLGPGGGIEFFGSPALSLTTVSSGADPATNTNRYVAETPSGFSTMAETSRLSSGSNVRPNSKDATSASQRSGLKVAFPVQAGESYEFTKTVGIATTVDSQDPGAAADQQSQRAATVGADQLIAESSTAWNALWDSRIDIPGDVELDRAVHASQFYLLGSLNKEVPWSASPGGLSSGGYNGHVFWDMETWMFPAVLIGHPDIARAIAGYREMLLPAAKRYAAAGGYSGARFPWESARTGGEEAPPPFGTLEQHISGDIALAQWQYYLATGDREWLANHGWPVLSAIADFWASRALNTPLSSQILGVMPPDEYDFPVNNSTYTNVGAITSLKNAVKAAAVLGKSASTSWSQVAGAMVVPFDSINGIHPEYDGYPGKQIKQADTVMLTYPWEFPMPKALAEADLDYYIPRTDSAGPSMTDQVHAIDFLALDRPGCAAYTLLRRSLDPFVRAPFYQLSESRSGGTFNFLTGTGGFLQTFFYGFSGFRWRADRIHFDPALAGQMSGVTLRNLSWQGRTFTIDIGPNSTQLTLNSGEPARVEAPAVDRELNAGQTLVVATRRPDLQPTDNVARCKPASASATAAGESPSEATDGSADTSWLGVNQTDSLTVDLGAPYMARAAAITWGQSAPIVGTGGLAGSVQVSGRAVMFHVDTSIDGKTWQSTEVQGGTGASDEVALGPTATRYIRVVSERTLSGGAPSIAELAVQGVPMAQPPEVLTRPSGAGLPSTSR